MGRGDQQLPVLVRIHRDGDEPGRIGGRLRCPGRVVEAPEGGRGDEALPGRGDERDTATDMGGSRVKMSSTRWSGRGAKRRGAGAAVASDASLFLVRRAPGFFLPRRFAIVAGGGRKWFGWRK
jgi:hypothetical protein